MTLATSSKTLERALAATLVLHGVAMLAMAALLLPTMPGPGGADVDRIALIAAHPWRFRLGWFPWQLTAASDVALGIALVWTPWVPRLASRVALGLTALAVLPDQTAQILWMTRGIDLAQEAVRTQDVAPYLTFERFVFPLTGSWAALLYTAGAIGWTVALAKTSAWSRRLSWLSIPLWTLFALISSGPLLPSSLKIPDLVLAAGNALGFVLMLLWFALVLKAVRDRRRAT